MASQNLRQRSKEEPTTDAPPTTTSTRLRRDKKMAMARRGIRSLAIAIVVPLVLQVATIYLFGSARVSGEEAKKPFWHLPVWLFHLASLSSSSLLGLSAWLVWAEGGFRTNPPALALYLAQLLLSLLWPAIVFGAGATRTGLVVCVALLGALFGCLQAFRKVNPIAANLVIPCLAWVSFLAVYNYMILA